MFCSLQEIREVEIRNIISDNYIRIDFLKKIPPLHQHFFLSVELENLCVNNQTAGVKAEDISNEWLCLAIPGDDVSNLYYRVFVSLWEDSLAASTFNVK